MKSFLKSAAHAVFLLLAFPAALLTGFGRLRAAFTVFAHFCAMAPGLPGDYLRAAFYRLTLEEFSAASRVSFGSFFAHPEARVAAGVYIGPYCVMGLTHVGERTQIASGVQILSGRHQHARGADGRITGSDEGSFSTVTIGRDCWIGASAVIMADVGDGCTIGAGAVVTREVPAGSTALGVPAKVLEERRAV